MSHRVMQTSSAAIALRVVACAIGIACCAGGCPFERFYPDKVAGGAARLSVRNAFKLATILDADTGCGFASDAVKYGYTQDGEIGGEGAVTWAVEGCTVDLGATLKDVSTDCLGSITRARGRFKATATRTVVGILTGNPQRPVIPSSPDAVLLTVTASANDFEVAISDRPSALTWTHADIAMTASVHLAQSVSLGVCAIATSDATLNGLVIKDAVMHFKGADSEFDVDSVPLIDLEAQAGKYRDFENYLDGTATVWGTTVDLGANPVLDEGYDAAKFEAAYACKEDLKLPVSYMCESLVPKLAEGAAKLTVNTAGNLLSTLATDTQCGFAAPQVLASAVVTGEVGHLMGSVTYRISTPCSLSYATKTALQTNCTGKTVYAQGSAAVTGTMTVRGRVTGNAAQPIIPTSREPAQFEFDARFDNFRISDDASDQSLQIVTGALSGTMRPQMAQDRVTGACSIPTPVVTFENLTWAAGAHAIVHADGNALAIDIDGGTLQAQNGDHGDRENYLAGTIVVDGEPFSIPLAGAPTLDPNYDVAAFDASYACTPNMVRVATEAQCDFNQVIGDGAARLIIQSAGTIASLINSDSSCGFADTLGVLISPTDVQGDPGEQGSMTWQVQQCDVGSDALIAHAEDCSGGITYLDGFATVDATRTVFGVRDTQYLIIDSIIPDTDHSVDLQLSDVVLTEFSSYLIADGDSAPQGILTLHSGTLSALVQPGTAQRADDPSQHDVATPVVRMTDVVLRDAHATLQAQGMIFDITIADAHLNATNGSYRGVQNAISGTITIDGAVVNVGGALDPTFEQSSFDATYACTDNLLDVL